MEYSANTCPVCIDNTAAPGTELLCWNTGPFTKIRFELSGVAGGAEFEVVEKPGGLVKETLIADGEYEYSVINESELCLRVLSSGTGQTCIEAYLFDANVTILDTPFCLPFYLLTGVYSPIPLSNFELPFFLLDGSPSNIPVVPC
jgi:hypothetical protein